MAIKVRYKLSKVDTSTLKRIFVRFGPDLRSHRWQLTVSGLSAIGVSLMTLAQPWPIKLVLDYVLIPGRTSTDSAVSSWLSELPVMTVLVISAMLVLAIAVLRGLATYGQEVFSKSAGHRLVAAIRLRLFSHIQRLPQSYHDYRQSGELLTRLTGDMNLLQELLSDTFISLFSQLVIIVGMLSLMFWLDWRLALVAMAVMPFFLLAAVGFSGRIQKSARKQREKYGQMVAAVQESFAGIAQIKGFAREKHREKLVGKSLGGDVKANLRTTKLAANYSRTVELITAFGLAVALWLGTMRALDGAITPGDLIIFLSYLRGVYRPLRGVARLTTKVAKATARAEKILEIFALEPEVEDAPNAITARGVRGDIRFSNVTFIYSNGHQALDSFNCHIPAGKTTLIVGPNGAGKSTVAKLILRLYEPESGEILLDEKHIIEYRIRSLRKRITSLTQDTFLFRSSIGDNIAFGKSVVEFAEIIASAERAGAAEFISRLPEGYDTLVGEGGVTLSGGQRQLISFARAALRNTPMMIFDEPDGGLDIHALERTKTALRELKQDKTCIIVTHRLGFLDLADHVVFIRNGQLVEQGSVGSITRSSSEFATYISSNAGESSIASTSS